MTKIRNYRSLCILLGVLIITNTVILSCSHGRNLRKATFQGERGGHDRALRPETETTIRGIASYYGAKFHGRKTANGETFDMHAFTAAHKTLPFGTILLVSNLSNGKQVTVRINDRGPFVRNRILDLSYAAAREIGMIQSGTARIEARIIHRGN